MSAYEDLRDSYGRDPTIAVWHDRKLGEWQAHLVGGNVSGRGSTLAGATAALLQNVVVEAVDMILKEGA